MTKRQRYFLKQKLFGLAAVAAAIASIPILGGDVTLAVLLTIPGFYLIGTRKMCLYDDYYFERRDKEVKG